MADPFARLIGESRAMAEVRRLGRLAARSLATVLLLGESGTGKELMARAIHGASDRRDGPFVAVNCAAVPDGLLEAEFFGYAEGAFTGARRGGKPGRFEQAHGGTLFLDEVGELAPPLQAKLLRAVQEREVEPVGAVRPVRVDVRVIAASNRDLGEMVARREFRLDLYYRLNVLAVRMPALRERVEDLPALVAHLLERTGGAGVLPGFEPAVLERLAAYPWPGNVRELENWLERAVVLGEVEPPGLPGEGAVRAGPGAGTTPGHDVPVLTEALAFGWRRSRQEAERAALAGALARAGGNKAAAARLLGLSRSQFYEKLNRLGAGD